MNEDEPESLAARLTCRKAHASAFNPFFVFAPSQVTIEGDVVGWSSSPGYVRYFCPRCGSRVFAENAGADETREYEVSLGRFDEAGVFVPQYESWARHREPWLEPLWVPQSEASRQGD
ncbi:GFA family protein [Caulobacter zeae]|uniref:GFA family protein n=1 Tax=Caulobacter zeae TaxID=2055137 RepID=A0A2N5DRN6_9CAUL|nr:GFA family protein [Caulobacter zeae]PLR28721.1 GFA family protein [Caulobacter zeae]